VGYGPSPRPPTVRPRCASSRRRGKCPTTSRCST
jgi:hypothetical protein